MFIFVISNKDMDSQFVIDVVGPVKHMDVWIEIPVAVLIADEVSHWYLQLVSFEGDR